jgi:hypothetical protein
MAEPMEIKFPIKGINTASSYVAQPEGTTPYAINVRPEDSLGGRIRGGSRSGTSKYNPTLLSATGVQCIETVPVARDLRSVDPDVLLFSDDFESYAVADGTLLSTASSGAWTNRQYDGASGDNILYKSGGTIKIYNTYRSATLGYKKSCRSTTTLKRDCVLVTGITTGNNYIVKVGLMNKYFPPIGRVGGAIIKAAIETGTVMRGYGVEVYLINTDATKYNINIFRYYGNTRTLETQLANLTLPSGGTWENSGGWIHTLEVRASGQYLEFYMDGQLAGSSIVTYYDGGGQIGFVTTDSSSGDTQRWVTSFEAYTAKLSANISDTKIMAVSNGSLYDVNQTESTLVSASVSSSVDRIHAIGAFQKFYIAGITASGYKIYDPVAGTVSAWTPTSGSLPTDDYSNGCPYIALYRGRIVLWGLYGSPQNWYMSTVGDPLNWNYAPEVSNEIQAVAGNNSVAGLLGDALIACIPYSDDLMLMGGDHTMWVMRGDPAAGGVIDLISEKTGIRSPDAFCLDPGGTIYFVGTDGVYAFNSDSITSITDTTLRGIFEGIDYTKYWPIMEWSYFERGCYVSLVPIDASTDDYITYFYHPETQSWWQDIYPDNIGPYVLKAIDGNKPNDTVLLIGSPDGYIRYVNDAATTDDGTAITSEIDMQTIFAGAANDVKLNDIRAITDTGSATLTAKIYKGNTPQQANASTTIALAKNLVAGRSTPVVQRIAAPALRIRLSSTGRWGLEQFMVTVDTGGKNKVHRG